MPRFDRAGGHLLFEKGEKIKSCLSAASSFDFDLENLAGRRAIGRLNFCFF